MPYFVYRISPAKRLELVSSFETYKDAKRLARTMRAQLGEQPADTVRVIFAQNDAEAVRLLSEKREPRPLGEE